MNTQLKRYSLILFIAAVPLLMITDWYFHGVGVAMLFICLAGGLILDQVRRIYYPAFEVDSVERFRKNKGWKMIGLVLTVNSPLVILYLSDDFGTWKLLFFILLLILGAVFNWSASLMYPYVKTSTSLQNE